jgi:hypothetical protein
MKINLEQLLEFLEEKGDSRSALLYYAIVQRLRHGTSKGTTDELLGLKSPGAGKADGFCEHRLKQRNAYLRKAVYYIVKHEMLGEHGACVRLASKLKRFRGQYADIAAGRSCLETPLTQYMFEACWHDPGAFDLNQNFYFQDSVPMILRQETS